MKGCDAVFAVDFKQPNEERTYSIDISGLTEIQLGETVSSVTGQIFQGIIPITNMFINSFVHQNIIYVRLRGGIHGVTYKVTLGITTSNRHYREVNFMLPIIEY